MSERLLHLLAPGLQVALTGEGRPQLEMGLPGVVRVLHLAQPLGGDLEGPLGHHPRRFELLVLVLRFREDEQHLDHLGRGTARPFDASQGLPRQLGRARRIAPREGQARPLTFQRRMEVGR